LSSAPYRHKDDSFCSLAVIGNINCKLVDDCFNTKCFWKQRSLGRSPFWHEDIEENHRTMDSKYGQPYFPEIKTQVGTNCITVFCEDYIFEDGKTYRELNKERDVNGKT
jgi:hypothetical protein